MTTSTKTPNYTPEQTAEMLTTYDPARSEETIKALAEKLGKSVRSVVAKLSREGVYQKKEYKTKTGEKVVKKNEHADAIGALLQLSENDADSLTKCNKTALKAIFEALTSTTSAE